ncbi:nuclear transport factor 2 family protein [Novosphingobium sp. PASSN1]|uniref:nuclear transport factor 2 family protein n=1 Tax=Novosphingobium sp. PASSN1 TaxID=2015561 RepID=UPI0025E29EB8|nr:nuclear transport factor 2 family protein [Novosphingobium sp. PASSN1]
MDDLTADSKDRGDVLHNLVGSVSRLRDLEEIRQVRCRYHATLNDNRIGEHFDDCTEDVICQWDVEIPPQIGRERNREVSRKVMASGIAPAFRQSIHNHLIDLSGDEAQGNSHMEAFPAQTGQSVLAIARWSDRYRRENGAWRIAEQRMTFYLQAALAVGWATPLRIANPFDKLDLRSNEEKP